MPSLTVGFRPNTRPRCGRVDAIDPYICSDVDEHQLVHHPIITAAETGCDVLMYH